MLKRRTVLTTLASLPLLTLIRPAFAAVELSGDTLDTSAGSLTIHPVMHASLVLSLGDEVIYVDPAETDFSGLPAPTAILITHQHGDHFNADALAKWPDVPIVTTQTVADAMSDDLKARTTIMANGDSGEIAGLPVEAVPAYNTTEDRKQYHPKGVGNGYVLTVGDKHVYVAGDTEPTPEMLQMSGIDIAFLPMNLPYTMTEEQAADAVKQFKPTVVYPYHYRGSDTDKFKQLVGDAAEVRLREWYPAGSGA